MVGIANVSFGVARPQSQLKTAPVTFGSAKPTFGDTKSDYQKEAGEHKLKSYMFAALGSTMVLCGLHSANVLPNKLPAPRPVSAAAEFSLAGVDALVAGTHALQARKLNKQAKDTSETKPA